VRADALGPRRLGIGAVATVAAVGADELAMQAVHLVAADLALLTRGVKCLGLRLLRALLVHRTEYTDAARPRQRRF
jgi:hypothetical protein